MLKTTFLVSCCLNHKTTSKCLHPTISKKHNRINARIQRLIHRLSPSQPAVRIRTLLHCLSGFLKIPLCAAGPVRHRKGNGCRRNIRTIESKSVVCACMIVLRFSNAEAGLLEHPAFHGIHGDWLQRRSRAFYTFWRASTWRKAVLAHRGVVVHTLLVIHTLLRTGDPWRPRLTATAVLLCRFQREFWVSWPSSKPRIWSLCTSAVSCGIVVRIFASEAEKTFRCASPWIDWRKWWRLVHAILQ